MDSDLGTGAPDAELQSFAQMPGGLMPALHSLQHRFGYIDQSYIPVLADVFNISEAEVHGVVSFYKDFRTTPPKGPIVQVCRAEACQARGAADVFTRATEVGAGAAVEVEEVFCLGNCALGPSVAVDGRLHAGVDATAVELIVHRAAGATLTPSVAETAATGIAVFVPRDAAARSVGADAVAAALAQQPGVRVVRNGSRGMLWLEPLIEVETDEGRVAYGPVQAADVPELISAGLLTGADHPLRLGPTEQLPWMQRQQRVTFGRVGVVDPRSADDYVDHGGLTGLQTALSMAPADVVAAVTASGLRGRGGAAFPTGIKWQTVLDAPGPKKYVTCNADEGDS
ncbi:MAG TPA: NAD(P)H-dependent oxidoreductase subunit E, partial [Ilumatobacteraceae bacterium]